MAAYFGGKQPPLPPLLAAATALSTSSTNPMLHGAPPRTMPVGTDTQGASAAAAAALGATTPSSGDISTIPTLPAAMSHNHNPALGAAGPAVLLQPSQNAGLLQMLAAHQAHQAHQAAHQAHQAGIMSSFGGGNPVSMTALLGMVGHTGVSAAAASGATMLAGGGGGVTPLQRIGASLAATSAAGGYAAASQMMGVVQQQTQHHLGSGYEQRSNIGQCLKCRKLLPTETLLEDTDDRLRCLRNPF